MNWSDLSDGRFCTLRQTTNVTISSDAINWNKPSFTVFFCHFFGQGLANIEFKDAYILKKKIITNDYQQKTQTNELERCDSVCSHEN